MGWIIFRMILTIASMKNRHNHVFLFLMILIFVRMLLTICTMILNIFDNLYYDFDYSSYPWHPPEFVKAGALEGGRS